MFCKLFIGKLPSTKKVPSELWILELGDIDSTSPLTIPNSFSENDENPYEIGSPRFIPVISLLETKIFTIKEASGSGRILYTSVPAVRKSLLLNSNTEYKYPSIDAFILHDSICSL